MFKIDQKTGDLTQVQVQNDSIKEPRNFVIDPTGRFLLVGNQAVSSLSIFRIDPATGELTLTGPPSSFCSALKLRSHFSSVLDMSAHREQSTTQRTVGGWTMRDARVRRGQLVQLCVGRMYVVRQHASPPE